MTLRSPTSWTPTPLRLASCAPPGLFQQLLVLPLDRQVNPRPGALPGEGVGCSRPSPGSGLGRPRGLGGDSGRGHLGPRRLHSLLPWARLTAAEPPE